MTCGVNGVVSAAGTGRAGIGLVGWAAGGSTGGASGATAGGLALIPLGVPTGGACSCAQRLAPTGTTTNTDSSSKPPSNQTAARGGSADTLRERGRLQPIINGSLLNGTTRAAGKRR